MNNSRMWLVVKPTVGIPLFLGGVAIGSFAVHVAVLTNTGWVSDFLTGQELGSTAAALDEQTIKPASFETVPDQARLIDAGAEGTFLMLPARRKAKLDFGAASTAIQH